LFFYCVDFPLAGPALHGFFSDDSIGDGVEMFEPDEAGDIVLSGEAFIAFCFMLMDALGDVVCDAKIERAVLSIAEQVDIALAHGGSVSFIACHCKTQSPI